MFRDWRRDGCDPKVSDWEARARGGQGQAVEPRLGAALHASVCRLGNGIGSAFRGDAENLSTHPNGLRAETGLVTTAH